MELEWGAAEAVGGGGQALGLHKLPGVRAAAIKARNTRDQHARQCQAGIKTHVINTPGNARLGLKHM